MAAVGQQSGNEREPSARSPLTHSAAVRNCVRALVFAGAVGVTWLIGSSAASAHHDTDPEAEAQRAETGVLERLLLTHECSDESSVAEDADPENPTDAGASQGKITSFTLTPDELVDPCATRVDRDRATDPAPDSQAAPGTYRGQFAESEGETPTGRDGSIDPLPPFTGDTPAIRPLARAIQPITYGKAVTVGPVLHTGAEYTGRGAAPLRDVIPPAYATVGHITRPVTGLLSETTEPVTSTLTGSVLPGLNGSVNALIAPPVTGMPQQEYPSVPAPPVVPDVDQSAGSTSTVDSDDEARPSRANAAVRAGRTGSSMGATPQPEAPAPAPVPVPLPAVPGTTTTNGTVIGQQVPISGGGLAATVPAFPVPGAPELGALVATAHEAALRDLAGEPAVSPD